MIELREEYYECLAICNNPEAAATLCLAEVLLAWFGCWEQVEAGKRTVAPTFKSENG